MMKATLTGETDVLRPLDAASRADRAMPVVRSRLADYLELTKPRIAVMALFTVAAGYLLGAGAAADGRVLFHALVGAGLVAAGGAALNQLIERRLDARMRRTADRPLPAGRIRPRKPPPSARGSPVRGSRICSQRSPPRPSWPPSSRSSLTSWSTRRSRPSPSGTRSSARCPAHCRR